MKRFTEQSLANIEKRSELEIAFWLAQGLLNLVRGTPNDPFAPHSFVHLASHPVEGIEIIYAQASMTVKAGIRKGIAMLGPLCHARATEAADLSKENRLSLLQEFLRLCRSTICFEAAKSIAHIACNDEEYWGGEWFRETVYPLCVRCIEDMALAFHDTAFSSVDAAATHQLEEALRRTACAPAFKSQYAPRMLASLISITPSNLVEHLRLLSVPMSALHRHDPMELELAHKTAHRLVDLALVHLAEHFAKLDLATPSRADLWLVDALFALEGPLRYYRDGDDGLMVSPASQSNVQMRFTHPDLQRVSLPRGTLRPVAESHSSREFLNAAGAKLPAYFDRANKIEVFSSSKRQH